MNIEHLDTKKIQLERTRKEFPIEELSGDASLKEIGEYYASLTDDERRLRFTGHVSKERVQTEDFLKNYFGPDKIGLHTVKDIPELRHALVARDADKRIAGMVYAIVTMNNGFCEISWDRRTDLKRRGIGSHLMENILAWAQTVPEIKRLHAECRLENRHMKTLLMEYGFTRLPFDPGDNLHFEKHIHQEVTDPETTQLPQAA